MSENPIIPFPNHYGSSSQAFSLPRHAEPLDHEIAAKDRWHPKITIYRLLVLSLGIVLGTVKACITYNGEAVMSTTMEWISGVVVSLRYAGATWAKILLLQHLFFSLMIVLKSCGDSLRCASIPKPKYRSDERIHMLSSSQRPPVTIYRILVSATVTVLGLAKLTCAYMGMSTAASAVDWVFAVLVSTSLYLLGLYENNASGSLAFIFRTDHSELVGSILLTTLSLIAYGTGIAACTSWFLFTFQLLVGFEQIMISIGSTQDMGLPVFFGSLFDYAAILLTGVVLLLLAIPAIPLSLFFIYRIGLQLSLLRRASLFMGRKFWVWYKSSPRSFHPLATRILTYGMFSSSFAPAFLQLN
ncbi:hypothetical protein BDN70DRAFT_938293 [Pholiota conissans]|uniref:Uncharacterized protein n=1 Tax=Pholiota conissans TaxID=109636 RepID=A0A9P6CU68_9AGAR|nr:hypothetical protein BDN70DRAFT_938293 [Pholiota conissans]